MTPNYLISLPPSSSSSPLEQLNQDHGAQQHQEEVNKYVPRDEPSDHFFSSAHSPEQSALNYGLELQNCEHDQGLVKEEDKSGCVLTIKWMSSKMRLMKKMMKNDQIVLETPNTISSNVDIDNISSNSSCGDTIVRTCSDCNTTKTPLWRSGPRGPKSLCNACGIRQRKARRALAAAQAEKSGTLVTSETSSTSGTTNKLHIKKKRCKLTARRSKKKLCFEDLVLSVSKNSAYYQVFPQDEKEAAILLMALSCGLAHA